MIIYGPQDYDFDMEFGFESSCESDKPLIRLLHQQLATIEQEMTEKLCNTYRKYDPDHIPIAFDNQTRLKDKVWWQEKMNTAREIIRRTIGEDHDYRPFDEYMQHFDQLYAYSACPSNQRVLAALARGEVIYRTDPICRDDYQEPTTKGE